MKNKYLIVLIIILIFSSCGTDEVIEDPIVNQSPEKVTFTTVILTPNGGKKVSWNPSVDPENDTVNYKISFEKKTTTSANFEILDTQTISETSYETVANLQLNATYRLIVTAVDIDNNLESEPNEKVFMVQSPVSNLTSNYDIDTNCLTLNWDSSNNNIINYKIEILKKDIDYDIINPYISYFLYRIDETGNSNTTFVICDLPLVHQFKITIIAVENNGVELLRSESISVKTVPRIYNGNLNIAHQYRINILENGSLEKVTGNLSIGEDDYCGLFSDWCCFDEINNLSLFEGLKEVGGNLKIGKLTNDVLCIFLSDTSGFEELETIGGDLFINAVKNIDFPSLTTLNTLEIHNSEQPTESIKFNQLVTLENLSINNFPSLNQLEFNNLTTLNNIFSIENTNITSFNFNNLTQILGNEISIMNNDNLNSISGLPLDATFSGTIRVSGNNSITSLDGFTGLTQVGNIKINNNSNLSTISGFSNLEIVNNDFEIMGNNSITSLDGFTGLTQVGNIKINNNSNLSTISDFSNLEIVNNDFEIMGNNSITSLDGFTGLTQVGNIKINNNSNLSTISGFSNLEIVNNGFNIQNNISLSNLSFNGINYIGKEIIIRSNDLVNSITLPTFTYDTNTPFVLQLENNNNLSSITGFSNIQNLDKLIIKDNGNLSNIDLTNLVTVENYLVIINNDNIGDLDFLLNLTTIACGNSYSNNGHTGNLILENNYNLHDFCGLKPFFTSSGLCSNNYYIGQNAYNPTHYDIVNNNCSN